MRFQSATMGSQSVKMVAQLGRGGGARRLHLRFRTPVAPRRNFLAVARLWHLVDRAHASASSTAYAEGFPWTRAGYSLQGALIKGLPSV